MAGRGRSDGSPPKSSGSGSTRTARTLASVGPISTEIRPTSRRSTARNMSPAAAAQRRKRRSEDQERHGSEGQEARRREGQEGQPTGGARRSPQGETGQDR